MTFFFFSNAFGQNLPKKEGCIEIKKIVHHYFQNKNGERTTQLSNKANRPSLLIYLDTLGNVIERVGYGKQHDADFNNQDRFF